MAGPADYRVLRQSRWGEQTAYMVLHLQESSTFHVLDEPVGWSDQGLEHPALPRVSARHEGNGIRQSWLPLLTGERLTERRAAGSMTGSEIASALESVAAALQHLATHRPHGLPAVIDPDCVCRAPSGEWVLDYAMLLHNPETRRERKPPGVYAIGLLFFFLVTGEFPRLGRPALTGRFPPLSTTLLLPLIKAINESYTDLPELQQALVDCRRAGGFDRLAEYLNRPVKTRNLFGRQEVAPAAREPALEAPTPAEPVAAQPSPLSAPERLWTPEEHKTAKETLEGLAGRPLATPPPEIPLRDPSWAAAPWHEGALPRRPVVRRQPVARPRFSLLRPVLLGTGGAALLLMLTLAVWRPWEGAESILPRNPNPQVPAPTLPKPGAPTQPQPTPTPTPTPVDPGQQQPEPGPPPSEERPDPPAKEPLPVTPPPEKPPSTPDPAPTLPPLPAAPTPAPGTLADLDRQAGGQPHLVYINGAEAGWAWLRTEGGTYLSLGAFNELFHRTLYWVPLSENRARILNASFSVETADVQVLASRLWLRLTPEMQRSLSIQLLQSAEGRLFFQS